MTRRGWIVLGIVTLALGGPVAFLGVCLVAFDQFAGPWIGGSKGLSWAFVALGTALTAVGVFALRKAHTAG